jgi:hypothetical protein
MKFLPFFVCLFAIQSTFSQTADQVVQQQLEAYNARNIDSFMTCFHPDITFWTLGEDAPSAQGFEAVKTVFSELFKLSPDLHSTVLNRSVIGSKVIDYERIQGRKGVKTDVLLVMIYEVKDGKIWRAWAVRE